MTPRTRNAAGTTPLVAEVSAKMHPNDTLTCVAMLVAAAVSAFCTGCGQQEEVKAPMAEDRLQNKSVLMIIARQNFRDEELAEPKRILEEAGARVTVASSAIQESVGMLGKVRITPEITLKEVDVADYSAVVFVGGSGASEYWDDATAHQIARDAFAQGKLLCAICIAPVTLARAGILKGRTATAFASVADELKKAGANYSTAGVEKDGTIITAEGPRSAAQFGMAIRDALARQ